ncbi:hypothetical protein MTO96_049864 [Rhipicephalus appendiculatus]
MALKKIVSASALADVLKQAAEKGVCSSENAKVFLRDGTELEEEVFSEIISELPLEERIFIIGERAPQLQADATPSDVQADASPSGSSKNLENHGEEGSYEFKFDSTSLSETVRSALALHSILPPRERRELVRIIPEGTSLSDVLLELPSTPVIVAVGSLHEKCYVVCEQVEMFTEAVGFSEAALCFLTYYVCNMAYPDAAAASLEFLQM